MWFNDSLPSARGAGHAKAIMYTQTVRFCPSFDGVRIAYASSGSGRPLMKAPHWMSHLLHDHTSPVWGHLLRALSDRHTLVRYDQRGTGLSQRQVGEISFEAWVRDFEAVADAAGLDRFPILGTSQGAPVAIAYAARHPERVEKLVLYSGYGRGRRRRDPSGAQAAESEVFANLAELGWDRDDSSFRQFFASQFLPGGTPEQHEAFNKLSLLSVSGQVSARMIREFDGIEISELLPLVRCPTLVLHALGDLRVPFDEGCRLAAGIPNARLVALDSQFHLLLDTDKAWPDWLAAVSEFLGSGLPEAAA